MTCERPSIVYDKETHENLRRLPLTVFILEGALCVWTNLGKHSLFVWLFVCSVKTGTRRIIRPDELFSIVRLERRTTEERYGHLHVKSGWNGTLVMVQDFPGQHWIVVQALDELCRLYCWEFYCATIFYPQEVIFGRSTLQKRTSWLPKLVIYSPVQSWFRSSEVLCKIASHTVYCHAAEAAILKNLQWKAGKRAEVNQAEWEFTNGTAIFRSFRLEREKKNTSEDFHFFLRKLSVRWNEQYDLNFQSKFSVIVDKW